MAHRMLVNGEPDGRVSARDRAVQYGDGVFETLAVRDGQAMHWSAHWARLERGCQRLGFPAPDPVLVAREARSLCLGAERAVLKLVVSRGPGERGYRPPARVSPTRILTLSPWPDLPSEAALRGVDATVCRTRLCCNPRLAGIKHLNRLEQVLARAEWDDGFQEGVMLDTRERVIEGTMSNLFLVSGTRLATPDLSEAGVEGVTRARIRRWARRSGIDVTVRDLGLDEVYDAEGLLFCNSIIGVWPVRRLGDRRYEVPALVETLRCALNEDPAL